MSNCVFLQNRARFGGAIYAAKSLEGSEWRDVYFIENVANVGGAIYLASDGNLSGDSDHVISFTSNTATKYGGAVYQYDGTLIMAHVQGILNSASTGGFLATYGHAMACSSCTLTSNQSSRSASGIYASLRFYQDSSMEAAGPLADFTERKVGSGVFVLLNSHVTASRNYARGSSKLRVKDAPVTFIADELQVRVRNTIFSQNQGNSESQALGIWGKKWDLQNGFVSHGTVELRDNSFFATGADPEIPLALHLGASVRLILAGNTFSGKDYFLVCGTAAADRELTKDLRVVREADACSQDISGETPLIVAGDIPCEEVKYNTCTMTHLKALHLPLSQHIYTVADTSEEYDTIAEAIEHASPGYRIVVKSSDGQTPSSIIDSRDTHLIIKKSILLNGNGVTVDLSKNVLQWLDIRGPSDASSSAPVIVRLSGFTINGASQPIANIQGKVILQLLDVDIRNFKTTPIVVGPHGGLKLERVTMTLCGSSFMKGGGVRVEGENIADILLQDVKFESNEAQYGGGLYMDYAHSAGSSTEWSNLEFISNKAETSGGGFYFDFRDGSVPELRSWTVKDNEARNGRGGGGYVARGAAQVVANGIKLLSNTAKTDGGGLYVEGSLRVNAEYRPSVALQDCDMCSVSTNVADRGAAFFVGGSACEVGWVTMFSNTALGVDTGAIHSEGSFKTTGNMVIRGSYLKPGVFTAGSQRNSGVYVESGPVHYANVTCDAVISSRGGACLHVHASEKQQQNVEIASCTFLDIDASALDLSINAAAGVNSRAPNNIAAVVIEVGNGSKVDIENSEWERCNGDGAGALIIKGEGNPKSQVLKMRHCSFVDNSQQTTSGASDILAIGAWQFDLKYCEFADTSANLGCTQLTGPNRGEALASKVSTSRYAMKEECSVGEDTLVQKTWHTSDFGCGWCTFTHSSCAESWTSPTGCKHVEASSEPGNPVRQGRKTYRTLKQAVDDTSEIGDIFLEYGTHGSADANNGFSDIEVTRDLRIIGVSHTDESTGSGEAVIDLFHAHRLFAPVDDIHTQVTIELINLVIIHGASEIYAGPHQKVVLRNCRILGFRRSSAVQVGGDMYVYKTLFERNGYYSRDENANLVHALGTGVDGERQINVRQIGGSSGGVPPGDYSAGGAIRYDTTRDVKLTLDECTFRRNKADLGGAVFFHGFYGKRRPTTTSGLQVPFFPPLLISQCLFENNQAHFGGAIWLATGDGIELYNAGDFRANTAVKAGGAVYVAKGSFRFRANTSYRTRPIVGPSGVVDRDDHRQQYDYFTFFPQHNLENMQEQVFDGNKAYDGGAVYVAVGHLEIAGGKFYKNYAESSAAAIFAEHKIDQTDTSGVNGIPSRPDEFKLTSTVFWHNSAPVPGNYFAAPVRIVSSKLRMVVKDCDFRANMNSGPVAMHINVYTSDSTIESYVKLINNVFESDTDAEYFVYLNGPVVLLLWDNTVMRLGYWPDGMDDLAPWTAEQRTDLGACGHALPGATEQQQQSAEANFLKSPCQSRADAKAPLLMMKVSDFLCRVAQSPCGLPVPASLTEAMRPDAGPNDMAPTPSFVANQQSHQDLNTALAAVAAGETIEIQWSTTENISHLEDIKIVNPLQVDKSFVIAGNPNYVPRLNIADLTGSFFAVPSNPQSKITITLRNLQISEGKHSLVSQISQNIHLELIQCYIYRFTVTPIVISSGGAFSSSETRFHFNGYDHVLDSSNPKRPQHIATHDPDEGGGAVRITGNGVGVVVMRDTHFKHNAASIGGAVYIRASFATALPTWTGLHFHSNIALSGSGGAMYLEDSTTDVNNKVKVSKLTCQRDQSIKGDGGCLYIAGDDSSFTLQEGNIAETSARAGKGGGIYASGTLTLGDASAEDPAAFNIHQCQALMGGGVYARKVVNVNSVTFSEGEVFYGGSGSGMLLEQGGSVTLSQFRFLKSFGNGGAIVALGGDLILRQVWIDRCTSAAGGTAIHYAASEAGGTGDMERGSFTFEEGSIAYNSKQLFGLRELPFKPFGPASPLSSVYTRFTEGDIGLSNVVFTGNSNGITSGLYAATSSSSGVALNLTQVTFVEGSTDATTGQVEDVALDGKFNVVFQGIKMASAIDKAKCTDPSGSALPHQEEMRMAYGEKCADTWRKYSGQYPACGACGIKRNTCDGTDEWTKDCKASPTAKAYASKSVFRGVKGFDTIQAALDSAEAGEIRLREGVLTGDGNRNLRITTSVRFVAVFHESSELKGDEYIDPIPIIDLEEKYTLFDPNVATSAPEGTTVSFTGIYIKRGNAPMNAGKNVRLELHHCRVIGFTTTALKHEGSVHVIETQFERNGPKKAGATDLSVEDCKGGAVHVEEDSTYDSNRDILFWRCHFLENGCYLGGAVYVDLPDRINPFVQPKFLGNSAFNGGSIYSKRSLSLDRPFVDNGIATNFGGGIYVEVGGLQITSDDKFEDKSDEYGYIFNNHAKRGGGVYLASASFLMMNRVMIQYNLAESAPAIYAESAATVTVFMSFIKIVGNGRKSSPWDEREYDPPEENFAKLAAVTFIAQRATLSIARCVFTGNLGETAGALHVEGTSSRMEAGAGDDGWLLIDGGLFRQNRESADHGSIDLYIKGRFELRLESNPQFVAWPKGVPELGWDADPEKGACGPVDTNASLHEKDSAERIFAHFICANSDSKKKVKDFSCNSHTEVCGGKVETTNWYDEFVRVEQHLHGLLAAKKSSRIDPPTIVVAVSTLDLEKPTTSTGGPGSETATGRGAGPVTVTVPVTPQQSPTFSETVPEPSYDFIDTMDDLSLFADIADEGGMEEIIKGVSGDEVTIFAFSGDVSSADRLGALSGVNSASDKAQYVKNVMLPGKFTYDDLKKRIEASDTHSVDLVSMGGTKLHLDMTASGAIRINGAALVTKEIVTQDGVVLIIDKPFKPASAAEAGEVGSVDRTVRPTASYASPMHTAPYIAFLSALLIIHLNMMEP